MARRPPPPRPRRPAARRPAAPRPLSRRESARRIRILGVMVMVGVGLTSTRAVWLGVVRAPALSAQADDQAERQYAIPAERGSIVDRNGVQLATDRLTATVTADPLLIKDPAERAAKLAPLLGVPADELARRMTGTGRYAVLAKGVDQDRAAKVRDLQMPSIFVEDTYTRFLPQGRVAAPVVGLVGDKGGQSGLELRYNRLLTGTPGRRDESRDPLGQTLRTNAVKDPVAGATLRLTLDAVIQRKVEELLAGVRKRYDAKSAMAVVMRPSDGAILTMASVPRFNPNARAKLNVDLTRNRPVADTLEPGSTFKVASIAGAIEEGKVTPSTLIRVPEVVTLYDRKLRDAHNQGDSTWSVTEILERSSNKGTVLVAQRLGESETHDWITRFGFGARTGVDLPAEEVGKVPEYGNTKEWSGTSILNVPIGQGVSVTQLQLARAYAVIANGGRMVTPHLVDRVGSTPMRYDKGRRVITFRTARQMDAMLRRAVSEQGTGAAAQVEGYDVAGKTGTANKVDPDGTYSDTRYIASFVGYLPANKPQLVIAVSVDEPKGAIYGGAVAAPVFEEIAKFALLRLEIPPA